MKNCKRSCYTVLKDLFFRVIYTLIIVSLILIIVSFLPNVFLRRTSEINNNDKSKIAYIFKACWMSKGGGGESPNSDNDGQGGQKDKKI